MTGRFNSNLVYRSNDDKVKINSKNESILLKPALPEYIASVVNFLLSDESKYISETLGSKKTLVEKVTIPNSLPTDHFIIWEKNKSTPENFPRRNGIPKKRPIVSE